MIAMPKALIFDCDGTLALTGELHFKAFANAFTAQGAKLERSFYDTRTGLSRQALIEEWNSASARQVEPARLYRESLKQARALAAGGHAAPNPPVAELAHAWGARPSAVASNGEASVVKATLAACQLLHLFDAIVTVDDVAEGKPDPSMFLLAAERLATSPSDCLVLEDSTQGIEAARRAGMMFLDVREADARATIAALLEQLPASAMA